MANSKYVKEIEQKDYQSEVLDAKGPVILDFYSTECPPCEALASKFDSLADIFGKDVKFLKIFRQGNRELANELGVKSSPTLVFYQNGQETGQRLTGGIRKKDISKAIENLLGTEKYQEVRGEIKIKEREADILILGGGPAGLSAAIYAAQAKQKTILVDQQLTGGQVSITHLVANYPGTGKTVPGYELVHNMYEQAIDSGTEVIAAVDVSDITLGDDGNHSVRLDGETRIRTKAILLATGVEPRLLGIPGETEYRGDGVSYCATCDGKFYEDKEVVVIGGGNSAVEESIFLTKFATKVNIIHQFDHLQANKTAQEEAFANEKINFIWDSEPREFKKEGDRLRVTYENLKTRERSDIVTDGVFIFIGWVPNTFMLTEKLERNDWGYVVTDEDMATNLPGVYAIGDMRAKKFRQIATAVSDGCIAALAAEKHIHALKQQEKKQKDKVAG